MKAGEKRFVVTPDSAVAWGLKPVSFSVIYPGTMTAELPVAGSDNNNYLQVYNLKDSLIRESVSIGYSTVMRNSPMKKDLAFQLLDQLKATFVAQGVQLDEGTMKTGEETIDGRNCYTLKANAVIDIPDGGLVGNYLLMFVLVEPDKDDVNGVLMIFTAHESSQNKSFGDMLKKGDTGRVWETFRFN